MFIVAGEKKNCPICGEPLYDEERINTSCLNCYPIPESNDIINADSFKLIYENGFLRVFEAEDYTFICNQDNVLAWVDSGMEFIDLIKKLDVLDILNVGN